MKIILVRHAKVLLSQNKPIYASEMQTWVETYDQADIDKTVPRDENLKVLLSESHVIVSSALPRTAASLKVVNKTPDGIDAVFNEAEVPPVYMKWLKLSPKRWLTIVRLLSLAGMGHYGKSLEKSSVQAEKAAAKLIRLAQEHKSVLLLGHGGMNWLIAKVLREKGLKEQKKLDLKNWGYAVFTAQN